MPLSKPQILQKADDLARANGSNLSFRRLCPDLGLPPNGTPEQDLPSDQDREMKYYTWLCTSGLFRALVEDPGWCQAFCKGLKKEKKIDKTHKQLKKEIADEDEPLRGVFKAHVE